MAVGSGEFRLYSKIEPPLKAGDYRFTSRQVMSATGHPETELDVDPLETHVRVRSPQYQLPPDQVLSTFPPAGREGSFGARLPQIVIRRRTLPWERSVGGGDETQPWLALVLIAEGEAELKLNQPIAECVTPGVDLDEPADAERGSYLSIRKSAVETIFPTQQEVVLLAHAREVDLNDTELMMGDDDGFLAVVISNRLPLPGRDAGGNEVPVKYLACLVNLSGQFESLLPQAPEPSVFTTFPDVVSATIVDLAYNDHATMNTVASSTLSASGILSKAAGQAGTSIRATQLDAGAAAPFEARAGWVTQTPSRGMASIYEEMAVGFTDTAISGAIAGIGAALDPELRFPVLIHWSFTSVGEETFESLMKALDSGLLGTQGPPTPAGRLPLEVVETGHVGLAHRTRRGDEVRSWYRGPLLPHPPDDAAERLPLAHAADQVRIVVPDGREDISLAAAFEIGRLLGLSRPSMIAALMRWRQLGYQAAHLSGVIGAGVLAGVGILSEGLDRFVGGRAGALVADLLVAQPEEILGNPNPLVRAGRAVFEDVAVNDLLATGFALDGEALGGGPESVLASLRGAEPLLPDAAVPLSAADVRAQLAEGLDTRFVRTAVQAIAPLIDAAVLESGALTGIPVDLQPVVTGVSVAGRIAVPHGRPGDAADQLLSKRARIRRDAADDDAGDDADDDEGAS